MTNLSAKCLKRLEQNNTNWTSVPWKILPSMEYPLVANSKVLWPIAFYNCTATFTTVNFLIELVHYHANRVASE